MVEADRATPFVNEVLKRTLHAAHLATPESEAVVTIQSLGPFRVFIRGEEITQEQWVSAKARDLLAFFVNFRSQRVPLERVTNAIWPESVGHGRAFHSALYRLRHALRCQGDDAKFILVKGGEYWLDTSRFQFDVDTFETLLNTANKAQGTESAYFYTQAIDLYHGEYLSNLRYYDWPIPERQRLLNAYHLAMRRLASHYTTQGNYQDAIVLIDKALQIDALSEESHRDALRYYAAIGDEAGLVRQYKQLQQALRDELNVTPSKQTEALFRRLQTEVGLAQR
jgi:two-component SAPR family response regulator